MVKSNVKAFVRNRPTASNFDGLKVLQDGCSVTVKLPKDTDSDLINNKQDTFTFKYDGILENASQEAVYNAAAAEVVDSVLAGYSGCIFAYGQTGAGKTFTMAGDLRNYAHRGIIPRAVHQVFKEVDMRVDKLFEVQVSYLEIYNEQMYDLLAENPGSSTEGLAVMEDAVQGTYVRGLTRVPVRSEEQALVQYMIGEQGRSTADHVLNRSSSRSHCVFTIHLSIRTSEAASERALLARLHLVDLAGSERTKKTNATGQMLKEAQFINKSLSFLEQTVNSLARHDAHVPFRQSRLTSVLRDALGGNSKTVMIANIWGEPNHVEETLSTLRFASRIRQLTTQLSLAESNDPGMLLKRYERQIRELKQELAMRDALSGRTRVNYEDLGDADVRELQQLAKTFLQGEVDVAELPCDTLRRIREMYKQLRAAASAAQEEAGLQLTQLQAQLEAAKQAVTGSVGAGGVPGVAVGDVDGQARGFQIGVAPSELKPPKAGVLPGSPADSPLAGVSTQPQRVPAGALQLDSPRLQVGGDDLSATTSAPGGAEQNAAFTRFKQQTKDGQSLNSTVKQRAAQLKEVKARIKESAAIVNAAKEKIDSLSAQVNSLPGTQMVSGGAEQVLDAEHHTTLQELKAAKVAYRSEFDVLKELRSSLEPLSNSVAEAKQELIAEFEKWLASSGQLQHSASAKMTEDELDAGEAFERMQMHHITVVDPDSVAYHAALKKSMAAARTKKVQRAH